jgi:KaiC/GvpD/RAD55 family RecA-like ATPase
MAVRLSDIPERLDISWVVPGLIPAGRICTLSGPSATGKSTFVSHLVRAAQLHDPRAAVGLCSPEEDPAEDIVGRYRVNDVDTRRVIMLDYEPIRHVMNNPALMSVFDAAIRTHGVSLVVIDPITSIADVNPNHGEAVRPFLTRLQIFAEATECAFLLVLHDRKGSREDQGPSADMVKGSQEWTAVPRVNIRMALDPATMDGPRDDVHRLVGTVATNLSHPELIKCREALSVEIAPGRWRWQWLAVDTGRSLETEWFARSTAQHEAAQDGQGDSTAGRAARLRDLVGAGEALSRTKARAAFGGLAPEQIRRAEEYAVRRGWVAVVPPAVPGGGVTYEVGRPDEGPA